MHKGVIVTKYADQAIPAEYLELVLKHNQSCFGMARVKEVEGVNEIEIATVAEGLDLKQIENIQTELLDQSVVFFFGSHPNGFSPESLQPMAVIRDGERVLMAAFVEGDFSKWREDKSAHSDEFFYTQKYLLPKLNRTMSLLDDSIEKVTEEFDTDFVKSEVAQSFGDQGSVVLVSSTQKQISVEKGNKDNEASFEWGWTTNHYDYNPDAETAEAATETKVEAKPANMLASLLNKVKDEDKSAQPAPAAAPAPSSPVPQVPAKAEPAKAEPAKVEPKQAEHPPGGSRLNVDRVVMAKPPLSLQTKNQLRHWYKTNSGSVPENFRDRPEVALKGQALRSFLDLEMKHKGMIAATSPSAQKAVASTEPVKSTPAQAPAEAAPAEPPATPVETPAPAEQPKKQEIMPVIPASEFKGLREDFIPKVVPTSRYLDTNGQGMVDPDEIARREAKFPTFAEKMGWKDLTLLSGWDYETLLTFNRQYPHAAARLIMDLRHDYMINQKKSGGETVATPAPASVQPAASSPVSTGVVSDTRQRRRVAL